jgi:Polysaccharide lyase
LPDPGTGKVLFSEDFANGVFPNTIYKEQAYDGALSLVPSPGGRGGYATKCTGFRGDDYSRTPGSVPRCEGVPRYSNGQVFSLAFGKTYTVRTSYFLPADYQIDLQQPELSFQIHQESGNGRPPIQQDFQGGKVHWEIKWSQVPGYQGDPYNPPAPGATVSYDVANLADIRGKWTDLEVTYKPSAYDDGVLIVKMNGSTVIDRRGPNNYNTTKSAGYIKLFGWYKWFWKTQNSDATERTIYYGPTQIIEN